jgi:uncharacterized protein
MEPLFNIIWDDAKANSNVTKHGVTFAQAATVMLDSLAVTVFDEAHSLTEDRWFTLGISSDGNLLAVSHTYQFIDEQHIQIRLISAREATRGERQTYKHEQF